ncbi:unnamed protein product [Hydatigera taeniaeformis]|uniref:PLAT domain-containing protein n=1 Tax=Hydatigena taeniaeformis TaxID=6205 RepID=A0A0R3WW11_HYDTA|nr:unnamed protein product [Hydatigera taeniaeformis]
MTTHTLLFTIFIATVYQVRVRTGNLHGGGTSAQVYLTLVGDASESGEFIFSNSKGRVFAKDREAVFKVEAAGLGKLTKIRLRHDNSGPSPDWYPRDVTVSEIGNSDERVYYFPCNQWLAATTDGSGRLVREFTAAPLRQRNVRPEDIPVSAYADGTAQMTQQSPPFKRSEDGSLTMLGTNIDIANF